MTVATQEISWVDGQDNDAGLQSELYYIPLSFIQNFPKVSSSPSTFADLVNIVGDFELMPGKKWYKIYGTLEKGSVMSSLVGNRDGKSFENRCKFFHPGSKSELFGFSEYLKNSSLVILAKEIDGQVRVFGSEFLPAKIDTTEISTGENISDLKGTEITIKSIGRIAPVYSGIIQTSPDVSAGVFDLTFDSTFE